MSDQRYTWRFEVRVAARPIYGSMPLSSVGTELEFERMRSGYLVNGLELVTVTRTPGEKQEREN